MAEMRTGFEQVAHSECWQRHGRALLAFPVEPPCQVEACRGKKAAGAPPERIDAARRPRASALTRVG